MSEQAAKEGKLTYAGAHSVTTMLDCFYKFYISRSEVWVPNRNLTHTKRQKDSLLSNWCMLSCRLGRLHVWEQPPAEHHPDHAPLPHPFQRPSGQAHRSISFGTTAHVRRSLQKQKRQQQMWNNNIIKKKKNVFESAASRFLAVVNSNRQLSSCLLRWQYSLWLQQSDFLLCRFLWVNVFHFYLSCYDNK